MRLLLEVNFIPEKQGSNLGFIFCSRFANPMMLSILRIIKLENCLPHDLPIFIGLARTLSFHPSRPLSCVIFAFSFMACVKL